MAAKMPSNAHTYFHRSSMMDWFLYNLEEQKVQLKKITFVFKVKHTGRRIIVRKSKSIYISMRGGKTMKIM